MVLSPISFRFGLKNYYMLPLIPDQKKVHQPPQYQQQFIPISLAGDKVSFSNSPVPVELNKTHHMEVRIKRETDLKSANNSNKEITSEFIANLADNVKFTLDDIEDRVIVNQVDFEKTQTKFPSFHVTYWMFYPYSQVKFRKFALSGVNF